MKQNLSHFYNCISKVGLKYSCYSKYFLEILDTHVKIASTGRLEKHRFDYKYTHGSSCDSQVIYLIIYTFWNPLSFLISFDYLDLLMRQLFTKENIITSGKRLKLRYIKKVVKIVVVWLFNCHIKCVLNLLRNIQNRCYMKKIHL